MVMDINIEKIKEQVNHLIKVEENVIDLTEKVISQAQNATR